MADGGNRFALDGKVAVVTGGGQGIGRAVAERFQRSGATTVIWDRDVASCDGFPAREIDVADLASVAAAAAATEEAHGRIDILVNNAGISGATLPLVDYDPAEWRRIVDINLHGVFHCCRAVVPGMTRRGYGRVVNLASLAGKEGTPNAAAYSASKAAVIALTKSLGKELAGSGVLVNCVAPAAVDTAILKQMTEAHVATMIAKSPLGRLGTVAEVAELVAWLSSEACSFNTGAVFDLSGGRATY